MLSLEAIELDRRPVDSHRDPLRIQLGAAPQRLLDLALDLYGGWCLVPLQCYVKSCS
jgi:hypothetical protein